MEFIRIIASQALINPGKFRSTFDWLASDLEVSPLHERARFVSLVVDPKGWTDPDEGDLYPIDEHRWATLGGARGFVYVCKRGDFYILWEPEFDWDAYPEDVGA